MDVEPGTILIALEVLVEVPEHLFLCELYLQELVHQLWVDVGKDAVHAASCPIDVLTELVQSIQVV